MTRQTFSNNETPTYTKFNNVSNQTVPQCSTSQRTGMTSVPEGMMVYDSDLKTYVYYDGTYWQAATRLVLDKSNIAATGASYAITTTEVDINGSTLTFDAATGESGFSWRYRMHWDFTLATNGTTDFSSYTVRIYRDSTQIDTDRVFSPMLFTGFNSCSVDVVDTPGPGSITYKLTIEQTLGDGMGAIPGGEDCWAEIFDFRG